MNSDALQMVRDLDNDAIVIEPDDRAGALAKWNEARRIAENEFEREHLPDWSYIAGYVCYMLFARGACSFDITETYLVGGLNSSDNHGLARFLLASLYFETERLDPALEQLYNLRENGRRYFESIGQDWRYAKCVEMLVCAHIKKGDWSQARTMGSELEIVYRDCPTKSLIPLTLVNSIERSDYRGPEYKDLCLVAARLVRLTHSENAMFRLFPTFFEKWVRTMGQSREIQTASCLES